VNLTPKGKYTAMTAIELRADGHETGLTDADELKEFEGLDVEPGTYIICLRCKQVWPVG
jgi:hypothetical protein